MDSGPGWRHANRTGAAEGPERGAAVVDFALVGGLLTVIFIAVLQLTLVLHVRNTLIDAASAGARYGALADRSADDAAARTGIILSSALNGAYAENISVEEIDRDGVSMLAVTVRAPLPVIGLIGPAGVLEVTGHAALSNASADQ
ncbi:MULTISPECIES: TadE family protein [unclassified Arthrobacter]|uniref:TadE family protein n=1 Tax=unclassified Arthrobacter TaxID=235627 RepID=UPI001492CA4A|nr:MULTISPECIES: TadE family protein [unclassified Arthrobacter]MBE0008653.1 pilus assembly protein [Arthrobacter sp. AET 35A]NOJ62486.1 pilus assembly protein [Arthrobacter sp. 147(2020)]